MTKYRRKVLKAVSEHKYAGTIEPCMELHGEYTALEYHNFNKAYDWLCSAGYIDLKYSTLTDKGKKIINP